MVIAEALNQRKTLYTKAKALADQIAGDAVVEKKNPDITAAQIIELVAQMESAVAMARDLTVQINEANNRETLRFEGTLLTVMNAIAYRDELTLSHSLRKQVLDAIDTSLGKSRGRYYMGRKSKDDVKEVSLIDREHFRKENDALAEQRRALDIEIQKVNWSAEL